MEITEAGQFLKEIGSPLASLVILAVFAYIAMERMSKIIASLLEMFDSHKDALEEVKSSMSANTDATREQMKATQELTFLVQNLNSKRK